MSNLVKPSEEERDTNFQRASMTLDAGVKIYATRVDSVHTAAYQVLTGLSRSGPAARAADAGAHLRRGRSGMDMAWRRDQLAPYALACSRSNICCVSTTCHRACCVAALFSQNDPCSTPH